MPSYTRTKDPIIRDSQRTTCIKARATKSDAYKRDDEQKRKWSNEASAIVKARLKLSGMSYRDLQHELLKMGYVQHANTIATKLCRGGFSAAFFLMCLKATEAKSIDLSHW